MKPVLSQRQRQFAEDYLTTGNCTEAYRRNFDCEGLTKRLVTKKAGIEKSKASVAAYISKRRRELEELVQLSRGELLLFLKNSMESEEMPAASRIAAANLYARIAGYLDSGTKVEVQNNTLNVTQVSFSSLLPQG